MVAASALPGFSSDYNLVTERLSPDGDVTILDLPTGQALGYDANSLVVQPQALLFLQPGVDHHPLSNSAQMVDAGTDTVSAVVTTDLDGALRPSGTGYDIGCYKADVATGWRESPATSGATVTFCAADRRLRGAAQGDRVIVLDAMGRLCFDGPAAGPDVALPQLGPGVRFLRVTDHAGKLRSTLKVWCEE